MTACLDDLYNFSVLYIPYVNMISSYLRSNYEVGETQRVERRKLGGIIKLSVVPVVCASITVRAIP
jgi:hypothetical protein